MRILMFGTYDEDVHPRSRVLREGLTATGNAVTERRATLGFTTAERVAMLGDVRLLRRMLGRLARCWVSLVGQWLTGRRRFDAVVVGYLGHFDVVLARILHPRTPVVLDFLVSAADTARDRRRTGSLLLTVLTLLDRLACACADVVLVDTPASVDLVPARHRGKAVVVPVGAPRHWFTSPTQAPPGPLRVVFFGMFTPLQGAPTIAEGLALAVARGLDVEARLIGTGQDLAEARDRAPCDGVHWTDWVEPAELPGIVADHEVCIGILGVTPKALRVVPNKAYQGAAAGALVVTSDTPVQRAVLPAGTVFIPAGDASALADALLELADDQNLIERRRSSQVDARCRFAPERIVSPLLSALAGD